jgi:hypothetical protein
MSKFVPISYTDSDGNYHEHTGFFAWLIAVFVTGLVGVFLLLLALLLFSPILIPLGLGFLLGKFF